MERYLQETLLLNYSHALIQKIIDDNGWRNHNDTSKILNSYNYVRDSIPFGFNSNDASSAAKVLLDGYGQCNTKGILFMAFLRALGIPCRIHGFMIGKQLQKGAISGPFYELSPEEILHSWVEIYYKGKWLNLEGFILDIAYLTKLQEKFRQPTGSFCGYGVATNDFNNPPIYWEEGDTYIQKEGIVKDLGTFDHPDQLFSVHKQQLNKVKTLLYKYFVRRIMNYNIRQIRQG